MTIQERAESANPSAVGEANSRLEGVVCHLLVGAVVASLFSVFLTGLLTTLAAGLWIADSVRRRALRLSLPPFAPYIGLFLLCSAAAILTSPEIETSVLYLKKFLRFLPIFLLFTYLRTRDLRSALVSFLAVLGASAVWGLLEHAFLKEVHLLNRIDGFMSHWMTFSGQLMLGSVLLAALFLSLRDSRPAPRLQWLAAGVWILLTVTLLLTLTRGAWLGLIAGVALILVLRDLRWLLAGVLAVLVLYLALPASYHQRFRSSFDLSDDTTRGRLALVYTGLEMVRAHPWTGVGPRLVWTKALEHRTEDALPEHLYQHLHNNALQIAAELGLPALVAWLALWVRIAVDLNRIRRRGDGLASALATGGLGALAAFHVMGVFEYNFGDSEVFLLLFFILTLPYIAARSTETVRA